MKLYIVLGFAALAIAYLWWHDRQQYQAGYHDAEVKYAKQVLDANDRADKQKKDLTEKYQSDLKNVGKLYENQIAKIRASKNACAVADTLPVIADRVRKERAAGATGLQD